jgi:hypothetical protein
VRARIVRRQDEGEDGDHLPVTMTAMNRSSCASWLLLVYSWVVE